MFHDLTNLMHQGLTPTTLDLTRDATVRLPPGKGPTVVRAVLGTVVVTREGDGDDHVLTPGMEVRLPPVGLAVAWAVAPSRIQVWHEPTRAAASGPSLPRAA